MQSISFKPALAAAALFCALLLTTPAGASAFGPLSSFGAIGEGPGRIGSSEDVAVGPDGSTYVADFGNSRVDVFGPEGTFRFAFGQEVNLSDHSDVCTTTSGCVRGETNATAGALGGPAGVAVAADGTVYVSEYENNRISVFSPQGEFRFAFGKGVAVNGGGDVCTVATECQGAFHASGIGEMYNPGGLAVSPSGDVYVADIQNSRIDVFSPQGEFRFAFGKAVGVGPPEADVCDRATGCQQGEHTSVSGGIAAQDVAVAPDGRVFVSDSFRRISAFSATGAFLYAFGGGVDAISGGDLCTADCTEGASSGAAASVANPHGIGISPSALSGSGVFVADGVNQRVDQFTLDGQFVKSFGEGVATGAPVFETCTYATGCRAGLESSAVGAIGWPSALAVDCRGGVLVGEYVEAPPELIRIERFGESGTAAPSSCPVPAGPGPGPAPISAPSNRFKLGKLKLSRKKGTATLPVTVAAPGNLVLQGRGLKKVAKSVGNAGTVKLPVKLTGKAQRKLTQTGKAKVKATLTFTPAGGTAGTQSLTLKLGKTLPG